MFVHSHQDYACETVCRIFINKRVISMNSRDNVSSLSSSGSRPGREGGRMAAGSQACAKTQSPVPYPIHRYMPQLSNYQLDRIELSRGVSPTMCGPTTIRLRCLHE